MKSAEGDDHGNNFDLNYSVYFPSALSCYTIGLHKMNRLNFFQHLYLNWFFCRANFGDKRLYLTASTILLK
jgi:hypothetical protein